MSASYLVDLKGSADLDLSLTSPAGVSAYLAPASGIIIGGIIDFIHANSFTNLLVAAGQSNSGTFRLGVQTSDTTNSGDFVAPYSGSAYLPTAFTSGMVLTFGSTAYNSGFIDSAAFQAPARYGRINLLAETTDQWQGALLAGFVRQYKTTGSGGGFTQSPQLAASTARVGIGGVINV